MGQRCMGRHEGQTLFGRVRQVVKEVSILIAWSLEASIETADSMEARGYGLHGRTSFHLFRFTARDVKLMTWLALTGGVGVIGCALGKTSIYYYPKVALGEWDLVRIGVLVCYLLLMVTPVILDMLGEKKWRQYRLEI